ncbi:MAG: hypothetical protein ACOZCF_07250 [Bacillota bacterium]
MTGFVLLGHLWEIITASEVSAELYWENVPLLRGVLEMGDFAPGGAMANIRHLEGIIDYGGETQIFAPILCAPQTSGGLLISVPKTRVSSLLYTLSRKRRHFWVCCGQDYLWKGRDHQRAGASVALGQGTPHIYFLCLVRHCLFGNTLRERRARL